MRQGQQNRRGRGRNNNRKGHHSNPLSRSFESNGPAERIRGTPAHIAEKYLALARDAQALGDTVLEQNYLQHAEHYSRIIMAYRDQFNQPGDGSNGSGGPRPRGLGEEGFDDLSDDGDFADDGFPQPFMGQGHQQQPRMQEPRPHPQGGEQHGRPERQDRQDRPFRRDQNRPRFGGERGDRGERQGFVDRDRQPEAKAERGEPQERAPEQVAEAAGEQRRRDRFQQPHEQPEFLRRPVRRARSGENGNGESGKTESSGE